MTDDVLPDFGRSDDMVLPVFDRGALAVAEQEQQRQRGEPNLPAPAYPPSVDLGFGGPARSQMTFGENFRGAGSGTDLIGVMGEAAQMEAARGAPQPGGFQPSQLRNLPSRVRQRIEAESTPEEMAARREAAYQAVFDQAAYDLSQSRITPQSVGGTLARGLLSPENALSIPARLAVRGGEMALAGIRAIAPRLGRSETAARIAQSGVDAAITNTAIDPILQAGRIQSGGQEGYNPEQTALAPLVGGAAGALLRGAIEAPSFARREAQAFGVDPARIETPQSVGTETTGVPAGAAGEARIATPEAPIAREGQVLPDAGPVQRQAEAVSPESARIEAPAGQQVDRGAAVEAYRSAVRDLSDDGEFTPTQRRERTDAYQRAQDELRAELIQPGTEIYLREDGTLYDRRSLFGEFDNITRRDLAARDLTAEARTALERRADEILTELQTTPPNARAVTAQELATMRPTIDDAGGARYPVRAANDAEPQQFAALGRQVSPQGGRRASGDIAPMARQTADTTADRRFPGRQELPGEASKPRSLPENATPDEVRAFRVGDAQIALAERIGRKVEVDGRFTLRNALGQYDFKQGVIRMRHYGDMELFAHEFGHALEQQIRQTAGKDFDALLTRHARELIPLDANTDDPLKKTVREGLAEFMRMLVNNPAFATRQAPNFASALDAMLAERAPDIRQIISDASRVSQIDSGMSPIQSAEAMFRDATEPKGLREVVDLYRKNGLFATLGTLMDRFYVNVVGSDHYGYRLMRNLQDARFKKTGEGMPEFGWDNPYKRLRIYPAAQQSAVDMIQNGVVGYDRFFEGRLSPSIRDALLEASGGQISRMTDTGDPLYQSFRAYLGMRAARGRYDRYLAGDLEKPPVRMSYAEVQGAIADFEAQNPQFGSAADKFFGFNRAYWHRLYDAGIVSKDVFEAVAGRGEDYVPLNRYFDDRDGQGGGSGVNATTGIRRARGSTRDILDPIQQTMLNVAQFEKVVALNDTFKAYAKLAESAGEFGGRFWERIPNSRMKGQSIDLVEAIRNAARERGADKADTEMMLRTMEEFIGDDATAQIFRSTDIKADTGEKIVFIWEGGERQAYKLANDEMTAGFYDTIVSMSQAERDFWTRLIGTGNAMFSQFITNAPSFGLKNLVMDGVTRAGIGRHVGGIGRLPFAPLLTGVYTTIFDREFAKAYAAFGGIRGGVVSQALRDLDRTGGLSAIDLPPTSTRQRLIDAGGDLNSPSTYLPAIAKAGLTRAGEFAHTLANPASWPRAFADTLAEFPKAYFRLLEGTETAGRIGQTKIVFNHLKKMGLSDAEAFRVAVFEGQDVLDYSRRGAAMQGFTKLLPFLNPGVQGTARANKNLLGDPIEAAIQAYRRGGWEKLDGEYKSALRDAALNWGIVAAMVTASLGWWAYVKDDPIYQRASEWMKKRYWIIPLREGRDGKDDVYYSIPKPFDLPGALIAAAEAAADGIRRADPEGAHRAFSGLREGFIPRQFGSLQDFLGSNPFLKTGFEVSLGQRMGFEGGAPSPIIPMEQRGRERRDQFTGNTSEFAKAMGRQFNVSPLIVDHVVNGIGGTAGRDINDAITATFGNNPNMTPGDAYTKMFFGAFVRRQRGVGQMRNELNRLMAGDEAKYRAPANSYAEDIRWGRRADADQRYAAQDEIGKTLMTMTGHAFSIRDRQLHPLEHAEGFARMASAITRDLGMNRLRIEDRSSRRGQEREVIDLEPAIARGITNTINSWASEEIKNGLTIAGLPGYRLMDVTDTAARLDAIRALSPEAADEIKKRMERAGILSPIQVRDSWPEARRRLLQDRDAAQLSDLLPAASRRTSSRAERTRRRVRESNNSD